MAARANQKEAPQKKPLFSNALFVLCRGRPNGSTGVDRRGQSVNRGKFDGVSPKQFIIFIEQSPGSLLCFRLLHGRLVVALLCAAAPLANPFGVSFAHERPRRAVIGHVLLRGHARNGAADHVESQVLLTGRRSVLWRSSGSTGPVSACLSACLFSSEPPSAQRVRCSLLS